MSTLTLLLVRYLDPSEEMEWLIVKKGNNNEIDNSNHTLEYYVYTSREITMLELNDDLRAWMNTHGEQIKAGDVNIFPEYRRQHRPDLYNSIRSFI